MTTKNAKIQLKRANRQSTLETVNPVLLAGEPVIALDTGILKIGDGVSTYTQLPSIGSSPDLSNYVTETELSTELENYVESSDLANYVEKTDVASSDDFGVVKVDGSSITSNNGVISASTSTITIRRWS